MLKNANEKLNACKEVEQILTKLLSSYEIEIVYKWFDDYSSKYIFGVLKYCKNSKFIKSIAYISKVLLMNYELFTCIENSGNDTKIEDSNANGHRLLTEEELEEMRKQEEEIMEICRKRKERL